MDEIQETAVPAATEARRGRQDRLTYTVEEVAKELGIGRALAYEQVREGTIPSIRMGRRIVIPAAAFERRLSEV